MIIVGNKLDDQIYRQGIMWWVAWRGFLKKHALVSTEEGEALAKKLGCCFMEISVKNKQTNECILSLLKEISGHITQAMIGLLLFLIDFMLQIGTLKSSIFFFFFFFFFFMLKMSDSHM